MISATERNILLRMELSGCTYSEATRRHQMNMDLQRLRFSPEREHEWDTT